MRFQLNKRAGIIVAGVASMAVASQRSFGLGLLNNTFALGAIVGSWCLLVAGPVALAVGPNYQTINDTTAPAFTGAPAGPRAAR